MNARQYTITGMSCAACSARVENAVSKLNGVSSCSVNLLTNSMSLEGSASDSEIISAVEKAGYGASLKGGSNPENKKVPLSESESIFSEEEEALKDRETPLLCRRLIYSLAFLIPLMYVSMGHSMWNFPLPLFLEQSAFYTGIVQLIFSLVVLIINRKFFINGFKGLIHLSPNMDTLVALGSAASFCYSTAVLFIMKAASHAASAASYAGTVPETMAESAHSHSLYFESAAMILTLITVGKMLEAMSKGRTTNALKSLMKLAPETAVILENGVEKTVPASLIKKGDVFIVRTGGNIPADGIIIEGNASVDESVLTGESIPVDKIKGSTVSAATVNKSGYIKCEATRTGKDTTLSQIIQMVSDASSTKAPVAKAADKVSLVFVPAVMLISLITFAVWLILGQELGTALTHAVSVLVISCPCALGLATPVAIMVGNGVAARNGILFKTAASLEATGKLKTVALDKTGTLTKGEPEVTDVFSYGEFSENDLLLLSYALEKKSEHPLSKAVVKKAEEKKLTLEAETDEFEVFAGKGLSAVLNGKKIYGGNEAFIRTRISIPDEMLKKSEELSELGKTPLFFSSGENFAGLIAVSDVIREDSTEAVRELKNMNIKVVMISGDNERTANAVGELSGIDEVIADVLPDGKEKAVQELKKFGSVAMAGDGINDAPALASADIGIAVGAGSDVALDAADVVLVKNSLCDIPYAIKLSRAVLRNIKQNLFWAFFYNTLGIPLAAGVYVKLFGWHLNPMFGAAAMSLSSFCVVMNALRLNFFKIKKNHIESKKENTMKKTIMIEGMMCPHCEAHVKEALESLPGIACASANHKEKRAVVELKDGETVSDSDLKSAVEKAGYTVNGIK
ncbi:MAG: heavy metal translocating P-type ATPase [Treponema sp.]|nr:heavy metal translocating P-type ATPase [Treponema sp.]